MRAVGDEDTGSQTGIGAPIQVAKQRENQC